MRWMMQHRFISFGPLFGLIGALVLCAMGTAHAQDIGSVRHVPIAEADPGG